MSQLAPRVAKAVSTQTAIKQLRRELARVSSPAEALGVVARAATAKRMYEAIGRSVEECNQFTEIYLGAYWKFGDLVHGTPHHRPKKALIGEGFPGSERQRHYARKLYGAVKESDIPEYVQTATENLEPASIAGCLEWVDPGRHGNLKGEYEWYTPAHVIDAVRLVLGGIDLDPASCEEAQATVQATAYFTEDDDGLAREWVGRVFLNPPFAHPTVKHFADKFLSSFEAGTMPSGIMLSNACTDTNWWQRLAATGTVCFHEGRIKFKGPHDQGQSPTLGQTLVYLGPDPVTFRERFTPFGVVLGEHI